MVVNGCQLRVQLVVNLFAIKHFSIAWSLQLTQRHVGWSTFPSRLLGSSPSPIYIQCAACTWMRPNSHVMAQLELRRFARHSWHSRGSSFWWSSWKEETVYNTFLEHPKVHWNINIHKPYSPSFNITDEFQTQSGWCHPWICPPVLNIRPSTGKPPVHMPGEMLWPTMGINYLSMSVVLNHISWISQSNEMTIPTWVEWPMGMTLLAINWSYEPSSVSKSQSPVV